MPYRMPPEVPRARAPRRARVEWGGLARTLVAWCASVGLFLAGHARGSEPLLWASLFASMLAAAFTYSALTLVRRWRSSYAIAAFVPTAALVGFGYRVSSVLCYAFAIPLGMIASFGLLVLYIARSNKRHVAGEAARFRELGYTRCPRCGRMEPPPIDLARCHECGKAIPEDGTKCICFDCFAERWTSD